jgi:hypothetical protein
MEKTIYGACRYSDVVVLVFGILGNILVIMSILLSRRSVLKNNYYFLVLHLAICDFGVLIIYFLDRIASFWYEEPLFAHSVMSCALTNTYYVLQVAGLGMMLNISILRYRATAHPLKPAISRQKLKVVCGLVYIVGFIAGYGTYLPLCFIYANDVKIVYDKFHSGYTVSCIYFFPTIFMSVVYYRIGRALIKQNKYIKSVCSNPVRRSAPSSSFSILKFIRNRRTCIVCFITVLCYGVGHVPISAWFIWFISGEYHLRIKYTWLFDIGIILRVAGCHSVNPLIYGILDKKLLTFWKHCHKKKRRPQEN